MGKAEKCIQMLQYLSLGEQISIDRLAHLLETNPRNVIEYKKELMYLGYNIESTPGRYGGYRLLEQNFLPQIQLTEEEKKIFDDGIKYLLHRTDYLSKAEFERVVSRVYSSIHYKGKPSEPIIINRFPLSIDPFELEELYKTAQVAVEHHNEIDVLYESSSGEQKSYVLQPYRLFMYNNSWFVLANNKKNYQIGYYKLNRFVSITTLNQTFTIPYTFNISEYLNEYGMKKNGPFYDLVLEISGPYKSIIKDRVYGKHQDIEELPNGNSLLRVSMQNTGNVLSFVLGFGPHCVVHEPQAVKEMIVNSIAAMKELY